MREIAHAVGCPAALVLLRAALAAGPAAQAYEELTRSHDDGEVGREGRSYISGYTGTRSRSAPC